MRHLFPALVITALVCNYMGAQQLKSAQDPYLELMDKASAHAAAHGAFIPALSPIDDSVVQLHQAKPNTALVPVAQLRAKGIRVIPWTTNDPESMRKIIESGVDGLITDRPDLLQNVLREELAKAGEKDRYRLSHFDVSAHRGGRGLRPENTLPAFESGLDELSTTLETDTGVSSDHVSTIWHDQFYNPESCRRADGQPYTMQNRVYLSDITAMEAQNTFICDKLHYSKDQKNDLSLSPVSVAFAHKEHLINPYVATNVDHLFRFVAFYVDYYRSGPGKNSSEATARAANAEHVRFNIETKILPNLRPSERVPPNHSVSPEVFVDVLAGTILKHGMQTRAEIQSFDFRTVQLVEEKFPQIPTYYLTQDPKLFFSEFVPATLRLKAE